MERDNGMEVCYEQGEWGLSSHCLYPEQDVQSSIILKQLLPRLEAERDDNVTNTMLEGPLPSDRLALGCSSITSIPEIHSNKNNLISEQTKGWKANGTFLPL